jgi:four helix bundle protein
MLEKFEAFQIAKQYYWICKETKVLRFLQEQFLRASSSIPLNLAEGSGKRTMQEQRRYYSIALGSLRECQAIVELERIENPHLKDLGNQLGAILFTLSGQKNEIKNRSIQNRTESESVSESATHTKTNDRI